MAINLKKNKIKKADTSAELLGYKLELDKARKDFVNLTGEFLQMNDKLSANLRLLENALIMTQKETGTLLPSDIIYNIDMVKRLMSKNYDEAKKRVEGK
jgi:hypothetical protein